MIIKQTKNFKLIKKILFDPEMFARVSDDYTNTDNFNPEKSEWFGCFENDQCKGLLSVHEENAVVLNIHMHIPRQFRGNDSLKIGKSLIDYLENNCDERFVKINAKIPVLFPDVIKFAKKCGFKKEGNDRKSYLKVGKYYDRIMFGKKIKRG